MNRSMVEENGEVKGSSYVKQEAVSYGYDTSFVNYSTSTSTPTSLNQPLPGQPPLPPMPPPQGAVPPPPSVFGPIPTQVTQIHAWPHAHTWQWITPQATPLPPQTPRDIAAAAFPREMPLRNNYVKRERFNHNRNNIYQQRGNFHRKNRRLHRYEQAQNQFDQTSYFGATLTNSLGLEWQRSNEALISHMQLPMQNQLPHMTAAVANARRSEESTEQDIKEEVVVKKNKQRKPMSQSYSSRPWNREDAEKALKIENEYNKTVKAQSLIIKFPDPDLNKDIVREFHPGIQNIHFQSPSGPRYCFIQMAENINIDQAIKELGKIPFGIGHLKVERKSLRDEDNPTPEEIDPYTLYIGNLPESVNVNEVKSKFPTAARVDVGYAQKMRNTRYAFIRYNSVDESISAYRQAHDLMWDTRSIIVRFRRQRGNTCLPGEPKSNPKKNKDEVAKTISTINDKKINETRLSEEKEKNCKTSLSNERLEPKTTEVKDPLLNDDSTNTTKSLSSITSSIELVQNTQNHNQALNSQPPRISSISDTTSRANTQEETILITEIKEEPLDYDEMNEMSMEEDDDDDNDEGEIYNQDSDEDDEDSDYDDDLSNLKPSLNENSKNVASKDDIPSDHLDKMFSDLENITGDIEL
ncbi:PREDICTED: myb-like protein X [Ceratosolen solmsi marchali]|uniref:Myb-like protein X n=1 Tax=Ceratosolen solmsi marchali TaxID=326594 RepID=A0AAJ6YUE5_9HYME|nr:PREDICTED: myb-like protein X [Ceratosolen solmsi marchali]